MSTGIGCLVDVDGRRFADGSPGEDPDGPVALAGLQVVWGRSTTVDQPEASTCSFQVMDPAGGGSFLDVLRTGLTVDVSAAGTVYPDPHEGTFMDPGFASTPIGEIPDNLSPVVNTLPLVIEDAEAAGGRVLQLVPVDGAAGNRVLIAPGPFQPMGTNPTAWDEIPNTRPGQTWRWTVRIATAPGAVATVQPVLLRGPWQSIPVFTGDPVTVPIDGEFTDVEGEFTPTVSDAWVCLQVTIRPNGWRWVDIDPDLTWVEADPNRTWQDMKTARIESANVYAPTGGVDRSVLVFSGRITDVAAQWDDGLDAVLVDVTAQDFTADLANVRVGDEPWGVQTMSDRFQRIMNLARAGVRVLIDPSIAGMLVSYQDVDSQPATDLLRDLAQSVDGVMWSATHQTLGPYVHVEDPAVRAPLSYLALIDGIVRIVTIDRPGEHVLPISACDVLRDPVTWTQDVSDVTTRASIGWLEQGVDEEGKIEITDRTYKLIRPDLEATYGQRGISVSTMLQSEADAAVVAEQVLARTASSGWRAEGLYIDDTTITTPDAAAVGMMLELLDGTLRNGHPLLLTDLPDWSPVPGRHGLFLEGGTYTYDATDELDRDGNALMSWQLSLTVSNAAGAGASLSWDQLDPTWEWVQADPAITWLDIYGVGPAPQEAEPA